MASRRYEENSKLVQEGKKYGVDEAFDIVSKFKAAKFDETVTVAFRLGIDTKLADQQVRGATVLPHGVGKKSKILVFAKGDKVKEAEEAGADFVGGDDLVQKILGGWMEFDKVIATPDMMVAVSKVGRLLGPRGLMPNPKTGTVTADLKKAIDEERKGKIEFRAEKAGIVHAPLGKKSFGKDKLADNFKSLVEAIWKMKPATSKGAFIRSATVACTMSPGVSLELSQLNQGLAKAE